MIWFFFLLSDPSLSSFIYVHRSLLCFLNGKFYFLSQFSSVLTYLGTWEVVACTPGRRVEATSFLAALYVHCSLPSFMNGKSYYLSPFSSVLTYVDTWEVVASTPGRRVEATSFLAALYVHCLLINFLNGKCYYSSQFSSVLTYLGMVPGTWEVVASTPGRRVEATSWC